MISPKHENITLSFPKELNTLLHRRVARRGISRFVAKAVKKALEEEEKEEFLNLEAAYEAANRDKGRQEVIEDWKILDNLTETRDWEW